MINRPEQARVLRERGLTWPDIAKHLGWNKPGSAFSAVNKMCKRAGRNLPPDPAFEKGRIAYKVRASGEPWAVAAAEAGYEPHEKAGKYGAQKHAERHGLPWPPL